MKAKNENMKIINTIINIFLQKSSAIKFCADFITKHHEMIGNRSSYDKKKKCINENKQYIFYKKDPQGNSVHFPY